MAATMRSLSSVDCDTVFEALNNVYRRRLLVYLLEEPPDGDGARIPEDVHVGKKALAVLQAEMFHKHIPNLEEYGFVQWNEGTDRVVRGPTYEEIRPFVQLVHENRHLLPRNWID